MLRCLMNRRRCEAKDNGPIKNGIEKFGSKELIGLSLSRGTIYYSYSTLVAVIKGCHLYATSEKYSPTTGRHLSHLRRAAGYYLDVTHLSQADLSSMANELMEENKREKKQILKYGPEKSYEERVLAIDVMRDDPLTLLETYCANETSPRSNG